MERCKFLKVEDVSVGHDALDHPEYEFYCRAKDKELANERVCRFCERYRAPTIYGNLEKAIFIDGKMMLSPEINSVDFHAMSQRETEILGQFCDFTGITGETLKEVLLLGYLARMEKINENLGR